MTLSMQHFGSAALMPKSDFRKPSYLSCKTAPQQDLAMTPFKLLIDGNLVDSNNKIEVINPANEEIYATCPDATSEQLDEAVSAAVRAFPAWSKASSDERRNCVMKMAKVLEDNAGELIELLIKEQGKPRSNAMQEVQYSSFFAATTAGLELNDEVLQDDDAMHIEVRYKPLGVVGAIAPWNYPLLLGYWKVFAALVTGNCVVLKPSPYTPLTTLRAAELFNEVLPRGVLNVLSGGDELGRKIVEHPGIQKISFTGSSETGKKIVASAAGTLKRVTLELGGNDAAIVLPDAKPKEIAERIFWTAFNNSGQICMAIKRLYVHEDIYAEFCNEISNVARGITVGDGSDESNALGPIQNRAQFDKVCSILDDVRQSNAKILVGGEVPDAPGYHFPVTLVADAKDGDRLVDEEPFGPILPIIKYRDIDNVIERANNSKFGLGASVWTSDVEAGVQLAGRLSSGTAWVNQHSVVLPHIPFGGSKESGLGVEGSVEGLKHFTETQVINVAKS